MRTENTTVGEDTPSAALLHECAAQTADAAVTSEAKCRISSDWTHPISWDGYQLIS